MKIILQEKEPIHYNIPIWYSKFIPVPQAMKITAAKAAVDQEWEKLEKILAWDLTKVRSKSEVIDEARTKGAKVHFASQYRTWDTIDGEPMEIEWNIFSGFTTLKHVQEVQKFMNKMSDPDQFQGRSIFMSLFNDIIWEDFQTMHRNGHSSDTNQKRSGILVTTKDQEENGTELRSK